MEVAEQTGGEGEACRVVAGRANCGHETDSFSLSSMPRIVDVLGPSNFRCSFINHNALTSWPCRSADPSACAEQVLFTGRVHAHLLTFTSCFLLTVTSLFQRPHQTHLSPADVNLDDFDAGPPGAVGETPIVIRRRSLPPKPVRS